MLVTSADLVGTRPRAATTSAPGSTRIPSRSRFRSPGRSVAWPRRSPPIHWADDHDRDDRTRTDAARAGCGAVDRSALTTPTSATRCGRSPMRSTGRTAQIVAANAEDLERGRDGGLSASAAGSPAAGRAARRRPRRRRARDRRAARSRGTGARRAHAAQRRRADEGERAVRRRRLDLRSPPQRDRRHRRPRPAVRQRRRAARRVGGRAHERRARPRPCATALASQGIDPEAIQTVDDFGRDGATRAHARRAGSSTCSCLAAAPSSSRPSSPSPPCP